MEETLTEKGLHFFVNFAIISLMNNFVLITKFYGRHEIEISDPEHIESGKSLVGALLARARDKMIDSGIKRDRITKVNDKCAFINSEEHSIAIGVTDTDAAFAFYKAEQSNYSS